MSLSYTKKFDIEDIDGKIDAEFWRADDGFIKINIDKLGQRICLTKQVLEQILETAYRYETANKIIRGEQ